MLTYPTPPNGGGLYLIRIANYYYGGRTTLFKRRWKSHLRKLLAGTHRNTKMQRVFDKHREFQPSVLLHLEKLDQGSAEQEWLDSHFGQRLCLNLNPNAHGGSVPGLVWMTRGEDMRRVLPGEVEGLLSEGWGTGQVGASEGRKRRVRATWSDASLRDAARERCFANPPPQPGPEAIARRAKKHSETMSGRTLSLEHRQAMSVAQKKRWEREGGPSEEFKQNLREKALQRFEDDPSKWEVSDETRAKIADISRDRAWLNDGTQNRFAKPDEAEALLADGWVTGRFGKKPPKPLVNLKQSEVMRGRVWINNGERSRCRPPEEAESLLATGEWVRGRKPRSSGTG